jgi:predicted nuclease of predicted toxin-antitoxin system
MRVLFDQATPVPLRRFLQDHTVRTAAQEGWQQLQNGELLNTAEAAGFDLFITTDKNLRYQQNLSARKIAIILLLEQQWPRLQAHAGLVAAAVNAAAPGSYTEIQIPNIA